MDTEEGYARLGEAAAKRRDELDRTQMEVAQAGGLSLDRVSAIERGEARNLRPKTIRALERGLDWAQGSVRAILRGDGPLPADHPPANAMGATEAIHDDMERRVADLKRLTRRDLAAIDALIEALKNPDPNDAPADNNHR